VIKLLRQEKGLSQQALADQVVSRAPRSRCSKPASARTPAGVPAASREGPRRAGDGVAGMSAFPSEQQAILTAKGNTIKRPARFYAMTAPRRVSTSLAALMRERGLIEAEDIDRPIEAVDDWAGECATDAEEVAHP